MTWAEFLTGLTQSPIDALAEFLQVTSAGFLENWWKIILMGFVFWLARSLMFTILDIMIPHRLTTGNKAHWRNTKFIEARREKIYRESLETRKHQRARATLDLVKSVIDPVMGFIAFLTIFAQMGVVMNSTTGSIIIGAASLALGLGAQGLVKDIIGGMTVLISDAYAVGDYVDTQFGAAGTVRNIGLRLTTLEGADGTIWYVRHSEISKIGNLTAANTIAVTDITLTWNEEGKHLSMADLQFAEKIIDHTVNDLALALDRVDEVARGGGDDDDDTGVLQKIVAVLPQLVPTMPADTKLDHKLVTSEAYPTALSVKHAVSRITGRVPVFTKVETLGLVGSEVNSLTLRLRITLPPKASRSQAMAVLRRAVFENFIGYDITPSFTEVAPNELPAIGYFDREAQN